MSNNLDPMQTPPYVEKEGECKVIQYEACDESTISQEQLDGKLIPFTSEKGAPYLIGMDLASGPDSTSMPIVGTEEQVVDEPVIDDVTNTDPVENTQLDQMYELLRIKEHLSKMSVREIDLLTEEQCTELIGAKLKTGFDELFKLSESVSQVTEDLKTEMSTMKLEDVQAEVEAAEADQETVEEAEQSGMLGDTPFATKNPNFPNSYNSKFNKPAVKVPNPMDMEMPAAPTKHGMMRDFLVHVKSNEEMARTINNFKTELDKIYKEADYELTKNLMQLEYNELLESLHKKFNDETQPQEARNKIGKIIFGMENSMNFSILKTKLAMKNKRFIWKDFRHNYDKVKIKFMNVLENSKHTFRNPYETEDILYAIAKPEYRTYVKIFMFCIYRMFSNLEEIPDERAFFINYFVLNVYKIDEAIKNSLPIAENLENMITNIEKIMDEYFIVTE